MARNGLTEGVRERTYGVVSRWSPKDGPVHELGLFMLEGIAGVKIPPRELY